MSPADHPSRHDCTREQCAERNSAKSGWCVRCQQPHPQLGANNVCDHCAADMGLDRL